MIFFLFFPSFNFFQSCLIQESEWRHPQLELLGRTFQVKTDSRVYWWVYSGVYVCVFRCVACSTSLNNTVDETMKVCWKCETTFCSVGHQSMVNCSLLQRTAKGKLLSISSCWVQRSEVWWTAINMYTDMRCSRARVDVKVTGNKDTNKAKHCIWPWNIIRFLITLLLFFICAIIGHIQCKSSVLKDL